MVDTLPCRCLNLHPLERPCLNPHLSLQTLWNKCVKPWKRSLVYVFTFFVSLSHRSSSSNPSPPPSVCAASSSLCFLPPAENINTGSNKRVCFTFSQAFVQLSNLKSKFFLFLCFYFPVWVHRPRMNFYIEKKRKGDTFSPDPTHLNC